MLKESFFVTFVVFPRLGTYDNLHQFFRRLKCFSSKWAKSTISNDKVLYLQWPCGISADAQYQSDMIVEWVTCVACLLSFDFNFPGFCKRLYSSSTKVNCFVISSPCVLSICRNFVLLSMMPLEFVVLYFVVLLPPLHWYFLCRYFK